jgi:hypothetical protein
MLCTPCPKCPMEWSLGPRPFICRISCQTAAHHACPLCLAVDVFLCHRRSKSQVYCCPPCMRACASSLAGASVVQLHGCGQKQVGVAIVDCCFGWFACWCPAAASCNPVCLLGLFWAALWQFITDCGITEQLQLVAHLNAFQCQMGVAQQLSWPNWVLTLQGPCVLYQGVQSDSWVGSLVIVGRGVEAGCVAAWCRL